MNGFDLVVNLIMAAIGSLGFALLFRVPKEYLLQTAIGGIVCWGAYLLFLNEFGFGILMASLMSTAAATVYSEVLARIFSVPTPLIAIASYIPLVPGKGLYYCMSCAVKQDMEGAMTNGIETLECALGMAFGMALVFAYFEIRGNAKRRIGIKVRR